MCFEYYDKSIREDKSKQFKIAELTVSIIIGNTHNWYLSFQSIQTAINKIIPFDKIISCRSKINNVSLISERFECFRFSVRIYSSENLPLIQLYVMHRRK